MLIVMEDRNIHPFLQAALDLEALRRLDVFQIDAAECRLQQGDGFDEGVRIGRVHFDIEHVDVGEFLEEDGLAFHHRLGGEGTDRAQAQHGGAVGDDGNQIAARGIVHRLVGIGSDLHAGRGHAWRISQCKVALIHHALGRLYAELTRLGKAVIVKGGAAGVIVHGRGLRASVPLEQPSAFPWGRRDIKCNKKIDEGGDGQRRIGLRQLYREQADVGGPFMIGQYLADLAPFQRGADIP